MFAKEMRYFLEESGVCCSLPKYKSQYPLKSNCARREAFGEDNGYADDIGG